MALIQISDPEKSTEIEKKLSVGIDLGTTHSLIAKRDGKNLTIFKDNNTILIPSIISDDNGKLIVGNSVSDNSVKSIKRLVGLTSKDIHTINFDNLQINTDEDLPRVILGGKK